MWAALIERDDGSFQIGAHAHNHPADVGAAVSATISAKVKAIAAENILRPASSIVEEILLQELTDAPCPSLPKPEYIARTANRFRQRLRPKDPTDLAFELKHDHLPAGFFRADVQVHGRRHLMFATEQQLQYLARAKNWYVDGVTIMFSPQNWKTESSRTAQ